MIINVRLEINWGIRKKTYEIFDGQECKSFSSATVETAKEGALFFLKILARELILANSLAKDFEMRGIGEGIVSNRFLLTILNINKQEFWLKDYFGGFKRIQKAKPENCWI